MVDDTIESLRLLAEILTEAGYRVRPAEDPRLALQSALAHPPSLILLDVRMPQMSGFELCRHLKQDERTADVPVIFVSALQDVEDRVQGFEAGGVDFVSKPFQESEVLARVKTHLQLRTMQLHLEELVAERTGELKKANLALGVSEEKFRTVVEQATEGILVMQDRRRVYFNRAQLEITGYSAAEFETLPLLSFIHLDDLAIAEEIYQNSISGQALGVHDIRFLTKSGDLRWVSIRGTSIEWEGKPAGMVFVEDITARKLTEQTLRDSEARFRATFEQAAVGIAHVAPNGQFLRLNQRFCDIVGYVHDEMLALTFQDITHPDDLGADLERMRQLLSGQEQTYAIEKRYYRKSGETVWINLTVSLLRKPTGEPAYFVSVIEDIAQRKQAEEELQIYQRRLKALAAELTLVEERERRRIAADLHDEVSQTLAFSRIQLAMARKATSETQRNALLDEISQTLIEMIRTTRTLVFDLSSPLLNEIGLEAALSDWVENEIAERHGLEAKVVDDGEGKPLSEDVRSLLFRNVRELLTNVVKHANASTVVVSLTRVGEEIRVSVEDDGIGMDPEAATSKVRRESGFGLFSIQERMSDLGGSLEIVSKPGCGCTVILAAPLTTVDDST